VMGVFQCDSPDHSLLKYESCDTTTMINPLGCHFFCSAPWIRRNGG
jgi:hypothetical protein